MSRYSYLNLIKRKAKAYGLAQGIPLSKALELVSRDAGFSNYHEMGVVATANPHEPRLMLHAVGLTTFDDVVFEDPIWEGLYSLVEDAMSGAIADTNAWDYSVENLEVTSYVYNDSNGVATLELSFEFQGEQDEDRPWSGSNFFLDAELLLIFRDSWSLAEDDPLTIKEVTCDRDIDHEDQLSYERAEYFAEQQKAGEQADPSDFRELGQN
jgi:hypothetical protein